MKHEFPEKKFLGFGLGLRPDHYQAILEATSLDVDWFEIITENYCVPGGKPLHFLDRIRERYPVVMHGVSLSIGSNDPLDWEYLQAVKQLSQRIEPRWISDHLCWTGVHGKNTHDLLPLPYTEEVVKHIASRVMRIQDFLGRRILLENVSSYVTYHASVMTEWEFFRAVCEASDCLILLDINNVYVSSRNHAFSPMDYIEAMPAERVCQIHLAGHSQEGDYLIDTHDAEVISPVWDLYQQTIRQIGVVSTMIERDDNIPPLDCLIHELSLARQMVKSASEEVFV